MKSKKCPICGTLNPINSRYCTNGSCCESLMNAEIVSPEDEETQKDSLPAQMTSDSMNERKQPTPPMRQCPDCKRVLPYRIKRCECGTSMIGVPPISDELSAPEPIFSQPKSCFMLRSEDGKCEISLKDGDDIVLGRETSCADYLSTKDYVSGSHARIRVLGSNVTIEHIGRTNPTLVNGVEIERDVPYSLNEGDLVAMGARQGKGFSNSVGYFRVIKKQS